MAWKPLNTLSSALEAVRHAGGGAIQMDTLHIVRCGISSTELADLDASDLGYLQLADAPLVTPQAETLPPALVSNLRPGESFLQLEARLGRQLPGSGELAIESILRDLEKAIDASTPVAVEVPDISARRASGPEAFVREAHRRTRQFANDLDAAIS
jgi:sugar phosphate isomerase/epimerase